jgi:TPR repeat protein
MGIGAPLVIVVFTASTVLSGCGEPVVALVKPYQDADGQIIPGRTTRGEVPVLLGEPYLINPNRKSEMYATEGDGIGFVTIIPVPADYLHYLIIYYDEAERVDSLLRGDIPLSGGNVDSHRPELSDMLSISKYQEKRQRDRVIEREESAEEGNPEAQLQLYYSDASSPEGLKWLCRSADQGHPHAQTEVASLYLKGRGGMTRDLTRAYLWYSLAVRNGNEGYRWRLEEVARLMTPEQGAKAAEMLGNWQPGQCEQELILHQLDD